MKLEKPTRFGVELLPPLVSGVSVSQRCGNLFVCFFFFFPQDLNLNSDYVLDAANRLGSMCKEMKQRKTTTPYKVGVGDCLGM